MSGAAKSLVSEHAARHSRMIAATLMVMMPWEAPRRSGYDACVAPEDAALHI